MPLKIRILKKVLHKESITAVRINTAHDTPEIWKEMAKMVQTINQQYREACPLKIYVDLAGPKIRTGEIKKRTELFRVCTKDMKTFMLVPATGNMTHLIEKEGEHRSAVIAVDDEFYGYLEHADMIEINDHDRKTRFYKIDRWTPDINVPSSVEKRLRFLLKTEIKIQQDKRHYKITTPTNFKMVPDEIRVFEGDRIILSGKTALGHRVENADFKAIVSFKNG